MTNYGGKAAELFSQGYNCAQSVAGAFAETFGIELDTMVKLASPFGGGYAGTREVCGAVSGMVMAIGLAKGYSTPGAAEQKMAVYALAQEAIAEFKKAAGSEVCSELLAMQRDNAGAALSCCELCRLAADIAAKHID